MAIVPQKKKGKRKVDAPLTNPTEVYIRGNKDPYGWLGNMSRYPMDYQGSHSEKGIYRTSEHLFQALRFPSHPWIQNFIRVHPDPFFINNPLKGAKALAGKYKHHLDDLPPRDIKWDIKTGTWKGLWDEHENDIPRMRLCLVLKLEQHPELKDLLLATGDKNILEDCSARDHSSARFWGAVYVNGEWEGKNWLGKLWMKLRYNLQRNILPTWELLDKELSTCQMAGLNNKHKNMTGKEIEDENAVTKALEEHEKAKLLVASTKAAAIKAQKKLVADAEAVLARLQATLAEITGEALEEKPATTTRVRLTAEEKAALPQELLDVISAGGTDGVSMAKIKESLVGKPEFSIKQALDALKADGAVEMQGERSKATYHVVTGTKTPKPKAAAKPKKK